MEQAKIARLKAYAPYSKFKVGASILFNDGEYVTGCNIENVSYGLTICAERVALFNMVLKGYEARDVVEMNIIADTEDVCYPCGACRQVMVELLNPDTVINLGNLKGDIKSFRLSDLMPNAFEVLK